MRWRYIGRNPVAESGRNPQPRPKELQPFEPEQVDTLAEELSPRYGALVVVAAETGLRPRSGSRLNGATSTGQGEPCTSSGSSPTAD